MLYTPLNLGINITITCSDYPMKTLDTVAAIRHVKIDIISASLLLTVDYEVRNHA